MSDNEYDDEEFDEYDADAFDEESAPDSQGEDDEKESEKEVTQKPEQDHSSATARAKQAAPEAAQHCQIPESSAYEAEFQTDCGSSKIGTKVKNEKMTANCTDVHSQRGKLEFHHASAVEGTPHSSPQQHKERCINDYASNDFAEGDDKGRAVEKEWEGSANRFAGDVGKKSKKEKKVQQFTDKQIKSNDMIAMFENELEKKRLNDSGVVDRDLPHPRSIVEGSSLANTGSAIRTSPVGQQPYNKAQTSPARPFNVRDRENSQRSRQESEDGASQKKSRDRESVINRSSLLHSIFHEKSKAISDDPYKEKLAQLEQHLDEDLALDDHSCVVKARREAAACKIQAVFRGVQARKGLESEGRLSAKHRSIAQPIKFRTVPGSISLQSPRKRPSSAGVTRGSSSSKTSGWDISPRPIIPLSTTRTRPSSSRAGWPSARCRQAPKVSVEQHLPFALVYNNRREERYRRVTMERKRLLGIAQQRECWY